MNDELENEDSEEETFAIAEHEPATDEPLFEQSPAETAVDSKEKAGWLCQIDGNQLGPLSSQQLRKLARAGTLTKESQVRKTDSNKWIPAGDVPKLFDPPKKKKKKKKRTGHPAGYLPPILEIYGRAIMVICAIIGIVNAVGIVLMTTVFNRGIPIAGVIFLWILGVFQTYIWLVGYKLGGGLSCGEKQAAQGLAVLFVVFSLIGVGLMFLSDGSGVIPGMITCAVSAAVFIPPVAIAYKYRDSLV